MFVNQPLAASELPPDDDSGIDIKEMLAGCYRRIASLPSKQYKLSPDAFKRFQIVYNHLEQLRVNDSQPGMRAVYSKMEGAIGRLALNLHIVKAAFSGVHDIEISVETMNQAIALAEFYIGQVKALHAESKAEKGELSPLLTKLLEYANAKGTLTPLEATRKFNAIKDSPQALTHLRELESMGYGVIEKQKRNWVFIPNKISRNDFEISRNGSRNGLESISNNGCSDSRHDLSENENLPDFHSGNGLAPEEKNSKIIASIAFIARNAETLTEQGENSRNDSRNGLAENHCVKEVELVAAPLPESNVGAMKKIDGR